MTASEESFCPTFTKCDLGRPLRVDAQDQAVRERFERLKRRRGGALHQGSGLVRKLFTSLPRPVKDAIKASRMVRKAAETFTGRRIAVSGDDHGFANLEELCATLETLTGGQEPFMKLPSPGRKPQSTRVRAVS